MCIGGWLDTIQQYHDTVSANPISTLLILLQFKLLPLTTVATNTIEIGKFVKLWNEERHLQTRKMLGEEKCVGKRKNLLC